ncbi:MAG: hypothetical protein AB4050_18705 [Synechococcus sp.]
MALGLSLPTFAQRPPQPRVLEWTVTLDDPSELLVGEGDSIEPGQPVVVRTNALRQLESRKDRLNVQLDRLQLVDLNVPALPADVEAYSARLEREKFEYENAERQVSVQQNILDLMAENSNVTELVIDHETARLRELQAMAIIQRLEVEEIEGEIADASARAATATAAARFDANVEAQRNAIAQSGVLAQLEAVDRDIQAAQAFTAPFGGEISYVEFLDATDGRIRALLHVQPSDR